ncbi:MAG: sodium-translocating pyrophosphatase [Patescibacteria group bacterium]|jgi:K(+)-stimulated pyrophosphate-energized sodium pump|nr:sodium-translocating pyrophosphatase [Patescibacteria group bacterium]
MNQLELWTGLVGLIGLAFAGFTAMKIKKQPVTNDKAKEISGHIHQGAMAFLNKEYRILAIFIVVVAILILAVPALSWKTAVCFVVGAVFSIAAGNIGMRIATMANVRTAEAAKNDLHDGLSVAFSSGSVMGLSVVGLGLLGVSVLYYIFRDPQIIYGFGFGASSVALFARVGGGIYTKAADVGADLVGKVEAGIPEDDPRNPATIADNVGDNVGDVAGMGADLFESYVDSLIAAMALGVLGVATYGSKAVVLPLLLAATGLLAAILGNFVVKFLKNGKPHNALNMGIWSAGILTAIGSFPVIYYTVGRVDVYWALLTGLVSGIVIGLVTEYYTSDKNKPAQAVAKASESGPATNLIAGFALGLISTVIPVIVVCIAIWLSFYFSGLFGIAIAAVGMLATLGITLATDTYGPVADNAAGIAEMAGMGQEARARAEELDAVGNTTAAIGKGFAIGSAALTALVLLVSFGQAVNLEVVNLLNSNVLIGLFLGGLLPFVFSAFSMKAVGKAADEMVQEVRRQFREIPGIMEGTGKPDYTRCVDISTGAALKRMIAPGVLAVAAPIVVGLVMGPATLTGLLAGSLVSGFLLAILMANAGGAWDNAKKYIESGNLGGKGSIAHKAAVVGDTVGDPFKDTSGPSLNILIKLMTIVSLIIAPLLLAL